MKRFLIAVAVVVALGVGAKPAHAQHGFGHGVSRHGHLGGGQTHWGGHGHGSHGRYGNSGRHASYGHYGSSYAPAFPQFHVDYGAIHFNFAPARPAYRHVHVAPYYAAPHFDHHD